MGAGRTPVLNYLVKILGPSFLACLLIVLLASFLVRELPVSRDMAHLYFISALVVFVPFFQTSRCLRLSSQPSANRAFLFASGAIVAFVGGIFARNMLISLPPSWEWFLNFCMAVTTTALLLLFRRILLGKMKMLPVAIALLSTIVFAMIILGIGVKLMDKHLPIQFGRFSLEVRQVLFCLYVHIVCAAWWLSDRTVPCAS